MRPPYQNGGLCSYYSRRRDPRKWNQRLPEEEKWTAAGWDLLKGLPWDTKPRARRRAAAGEEDDPKEEAPDADEHKPMTIGEEAKPLVLPSLPPDKIRKNSQETFTLLRQM